ncbi:c-type cytochrome [Sphingomonas sp. 22R3R2A-7]|uniref:c-type cytochrome n=1 Tax=Sphingomonas sp. 22R3R2A-7 TaxID=3050230 RepID=UPI002FE2C75E
MRPAVRIQQATPAAPRAASPPPRRAPEYSGAALPATRSAAISTDTDGPNLYGVMGGPIGERRARFSYTAGLKALGGRWDDARMDRWLTNPRALVPGTTMNFGGLRDPADRADVIAYLKTQGP